MKKPTKRLPTGRPFGIPQPSGPERIKRKLPVLYDSILKRAIGGDAWNACLALVIVEALPVEALKSFQDKLDKFVFIGVSGEVKPRLVLQHKGEVS